jgi:hypothetical protein
VLAAGLEAEREAAEQAEAAKAEEFRARQRAGQRTGCSPDSAAVALAQEKLARVTAAQQAKIDDWQARNAASLAATGKPLRNRHGSRLAGTAGSRRPPPRWAPPLRRRPSRSAGS